MRPLPAYHEGVTTSDPQTAISHTALSLFSGAGGLGLGFAAAGFGVRLAVDQDSQAVATLRGHRPDLKVAEQDVTDLTPADLLNRAGLNRGEADLLIAGPPCEPFSKSGYWATGDSGRLHDPRADTLAATLHLIGGTLPAVFVLENVAGIQYTGKDEGLTLILEQVRAINRAHGTRYVPVWQVCDAVAYGVPQQRSRFFLVAEREGRVFRFPPPTHDTPGTLDLQSEEEGTHRQPALLSGPPAVPLRAAVTAWDATGHLPPPSPDEDLRLQGRWAGLLPSIPEGENYLWHTDRRGGRPLFGWRTRYWSFLLKLAKARPAWTLQASPGPATGPFHWDNRRLSVAELAALQTFPPDLLFAGPRRVQQRLIGNAVPPLLAEVIARAVAEQFFGRTFTGPPVHQVEVKATCPPPRPPEAVPASFLHLLGTHAAHPGIGLGPAATLRDTPEPPDAQHGLF